MAILAVIVVLSIMYVVNYMAITQALKTPLERAMTRMHTDNPANETLQIARGAYGVSTYEDRNLHVKLAYPSSWLVSHPTSDEGCMMIGGLKSPECFIEFRPSASHNDVTLSNADF